MKKIFTIFALFVLLASCTTPILKKVDSLPLEVSKLEVSKNFDTMLVINTEYKMYVYDKNGEIKGIINNNDESVANVWLGIIIGLGVIMIIFALISSL